MNSNNQAIAGVTTTTKWIEPNIHDLLNAADTRAKTDKTKHLHCGYHFNKKCTIEEGTKKRFPLLKMAHPIQVRVNAGEMLYLPSLWFHRVTQVCMYANCKTCVYA